MEEHNQKLAQRAIESDTAILMTGETYASKDTFFDQVAIVVLALENERFRKTLAVAVHMHYAMSEQKK